MAAEKDIDKVIQDRFFPIQKQGVLIEVGAAGPSYLSIGASFRERGWTVIAIEPNPYFCEQHLSAGHQILQYACSSEDKDQVDFYVVNSNAAEYLGGNVSFESFSSLGIKDGFADDLKKSPNKPETKVIKVDVRRLDTILAQHYPQLSAVDMVAIDVEGWELDVMRGFSIERFRPKVVVLENLFRSRSYRSFMRGRGYRRWKRLKPNEIYIRKDLKLTIGERLRIALRR
jgi:FkbM family methyltransferase